MSCKHGDALRMARFERRSECMGAWVHGCMHPYRRSKSAAPPHLHSRPPPRPLSRGARTVGVCPHVQERSRVAPRSQCDLSQLPRLAHLCRCPVSLRSRLKPGASGGSLMPPLPKGSPLGRSRALFGAIFRGAPQSDSLRSKTLAGYSGVSLERSTRACETAEALQREPPRSLLTISI